MEKPDYKYQDAEYNEEFVLVISKPIKYKVKQEYQLYEDDFGNTYYEKEYNYDVLNEAHKQNPEIQEIVDYLRSKGWDINEERIE